MIVMDDGAKESLLNSLSFNSNAFELAYKVIVFTNTTGTHEGPFIFAPEIDPTGKILWFQIADLYTIAENGTIVEHQYVIKIMDLNQMMGAIQFVINSTIPTQSQ